LQLSARFLTHLQEVLAMQPSDRFRLPALVEPLLRNLPDRFEHPKPRLTVGILSLPQEVLLDERGQTIEDVLSVDLFVADCLRSVEATTTSEHTKTGKQPLLGPGQEVIAPVDRCAQGPLPLVEIERPAGQKI